LEKGVKVLTAVTIPRIPAPIFIDCEVVWVKNNGKGKPAGMAVKFLDIAERDRRILDMYFRTKPNANDSGAQRPRPAKAPAARSQTAAKAANQA
jgi:hypothetical protein